MTAFSDRVDTFADLEVGWDSYGAEVPNETSRENAKAFLRASEKRQRQIRKSSGTGAELAKKYGVSNSLIYQIRTRKVWTHVE